jgi:hypothetical protein
LSAGPQSANKKRPSPSVPIKVGYLRLGLRVAAMLLICWPVILFPIVCTGFGSGASYRQGMGIHQLMTLDVWPRYKNLFIVALATAAAGAILWGISAILPEPPD